MIGPSTPASTPLAGARSDARTRGLASVLIGVALVAAAALAWLAPGAPVLTVGAAAAVAVMLVVCAHPPAAAFLMLAVTPLVIGVERGGAAVPIRPNEALLGVVVAGLALRVVWEVLQGRTWNVRLHRVDIAMMVLTAAASVAPLLWLYGRTGEVSVDDVLYAAVLLKYLVLYSIVRLTVRTPRQVAIALVVVVGAAVLVAIVAIVQTLLPSLLPGGFRDLYAPAGQERLLDNGRGTSTLASSIAVGDHLTFALAVVLAWVVKGLAGRRIALIAAFLLAVGVLASGQFSAVIALLVALIAIGAATGNMRALLRYALPAALVGAVAAWPVVQRRLEGFSAPGGVPVSWGDRLDNLRTYFWPRLADGGFWLGVRPEARVAAPESWRDWVWIESGHTWLLWTGGLPLLAAYLWFAWTSGVTTWRRAVLAGPVGVAATAAFATTAVVFVLMTLDPHLTLRGSADLAFPLLALALVGVGRLDHGPRNEEPGSTVRASHSEPADPRGNA